jgi:hypothetical protein
VIIDFKKPVKQETAVLNLSKNRDGRVPNLITLFFAFEIAEILDVKRHGKRVTDVFLTLIERR